MNFRVASDRVAHETVDGEVVILDPANGTYFSLTGAGAELWELLVGGATVDGLASAARERFDADDDTIRAAVAALVAELEREALIVAGGGAASPAPTEPAAGKRSWVEPRLEKFTDLQGLLLLDPIHEVDEAGWPRPVREE